MQERFGHRHVPLQRPSKRASRKFFRHQRLHPLALRFPLGLLRSGSDLQAPTGSSAGKRFKQSGAVQVLDGAPRVVENIGSRDSSAPGSRSRCATSAKFFSRLGLCSLGNWQNCGLIPVESPHS